MKFSFNTILFTVFIALFSACNTTKNNVEQPPQPVEIEEDYIKAHFEKLDYENFDALMKEGSGLKMAYFWAEWCGPCRTISPALDNISKNYEGLLTIGKLDVDANKVTADLHGVRSIPAFLFFKDGNLVFETSGLVTEQYLVNVIDRLK